MLLQGGNKAGISHIQKEGPGELRTERIESRQQRRQRQRLGSWELVKSTIKTENGLVRELSLLNFPICASPRSQVKDKYIPFGQCMTSTLQIGEERPTKMKNHLSKPKLRNSTSENAHHNSQISTKLLSSLTST